MEIAYLMVGKVFRTDGTVQYLNDLLSSHNLVANADDDISPTSIRRLSDPEGFKRYDIEHSTGDQADDPREFCVGTIIGQNGYGEPNVVEKDSQSIDSALKEVYQDIPDAKILVFSHWA